MKKSIVLSALVCGIVMLLGSCAGSSLKSAAEALNSSCPKQVNDIATMESVTYEDKALIGGRGCREHRSERRGHDTGNCPRQRS